jgi:leader peptidase (prepilin peptidase)/N-methyltransferase
MFFIVVVFLFIQFLCWGSFLNMAAYRLTYEKPFFRKRSYCPSCDKTIFWYDNIPLLSWIILKGRCRFCSVPISYLYPAVELLSGIIFTALFLMSAKFFVAYFICFSALIAATRADLQAMVIPQIFTLGMVPIGILFSFAGFTKVSGVESIIGAVIGYGLLWAVATIFKYFKKREGLGVGDMELLGMIGSFMGVDGVRFSLLIGSISGLLIGGAYLYFFKKNRYTRIPFGPFLALGAIVYFFSTF